MKVKFSEIHVGAFIWVNGNYACKIDKKTIFYRNEIGEEKILTLEENEEIEIEENHE